MKRLSSHSIWIALGLLIVLGVWLYFDLKEPVREPDQNPRISEIAGIKPDDVSRVEISGDGTVIALAKAGGKWKIEEPFQAQADTETVGGAVSGLLDQTTDYVMEKPPTDLSKFGLTKPKKSVTLIGAGKRVVLQIGEQDPSKSSVYTRVADTGKVLLASSFALDGLIKKSPDEFRDKSVLSLRREDVERIRVVRSSGALTLTRTNGKWALSEPISVPADEFAADGICDALTGLKAEKFVAASGADEAKYGLAAPRISVSISAKGGAQYGLKIGKEAPGGSAFYAARAGSAEVVEIAKTTVETLGKPVGELRSKRMLDAQTDSVERLAAQSPKGRWEVRRSGSDWVFVSPNAGKKADPLDVDNVVLDATGSADRWVADEPSASGLARYGLTAPEVTVTVTLKGGAVKRLEIGKKTSSGDRYARGSDTGASVFTVGSYVYDQVQNQPKPLK